MKRENFTEWDKIFANHLFDKEIISKIYKEFIQFNSKTNNPIKKWTRDLNRHFSIENIQMTNKCVKRYSTPFVTRKIQTKTMIDINSSEWL